MRITSSAKETAEEILNYAIRLVKKALRKCGKPLRRSRITILGVSGTPDTKDEKNPFVKKLMKKLISKGVQVRVYDPFFAQKELNEMGYPAEKTLKQAVENTDCIIITVPHERFGKMNLRRLSLTAKMPAAMVDLAYIINPEKAKKEGFAFLGLGRG
jgi:UDP-N-acetyl-D-mannosaminuronate dehydrogenase